METSDSGNAVGFGAHLPVDSAAGIGESRFETDCPCLCQSDQDGDTGKSCELHLVMVYVFMSDKVEVVTVHQSRGPVEGES